MMRRHIVWAGVFVAALAITISLAADMHETNKMKSGQEGNVQLLIVAKAPADQVA